MSENKVVLSGRKTKTVELPETKATVEIYASIIAKDVSGIDVGTLQDNKGDNIGEAIKILARLIKSWNIYADAKDEKPKPINEETVGEIPLNDLAFLLKELQQFITTEKKD